jgi:uncharacterized protein (DUF2236 family)
MAPMLSAIRLPAGLQRQLDDAASAFFNPKQGHRIDFARPTGEAALVPADSVSWRIFKNPVALFVGGVAAVILELAEPSVRTGVWEHSSFRDDPIGRLQRTGLAAMVTIYGARSVAEPMIARVVRMHANVEGDSPAGVHYCANDPRLLSWVHATAAFSFAQAYSHYVEPLHTTHFNALFREGMAAARLYGAVDAPTSFADMQALFKTMRGTLEFSPIVFAFLDVMRKTPALPRPILWLQPILVRAAVEMIPGDIRASLGLTEHYGLGTRERWLVRLAGNLSNRIVLAESPAAQSCLRLGLPVTHLYG